MIWILRLLVSKWRKKNPFLRSVLAFILVLSKGEVVQVSRDSANNVFSSSVGDLGRDVGQSLVRHSDSGN